MGQFFTYLENESIDNLINEAPLEGLGAGLSVAGGLIKGAAGAAGKGINLAARKAMGLTANELIKTDTKLSRMKLTDELFEKTLRRLELLRAYAVKDKDVKSGIERILEKHRKRQSDYFENEFDHADSQLRLGGGNETVQKKVDDFLKKISDLLDWINKGKNREIYSSLRGQLLDFVSQHQDTSLKTRKESAEDRRKKKEMQQAGIQSFNSKISEIESKFDGVEVGSKEFDELMAQIKDYADGKVKGTPADVQKRAKEVYGKYYSEQMVSLLDRADTEISRMKFGSQDYDVAMENIRNMVNANKKNPEVVKKGLEVLEDHNNAEFNYYRQNYYRSKNHPELQIKSHQAISAMLDYVLPGKTKNEIKQFLAKEQDKMGV